MSDVTAVPLRPIAKGSMTRLWLGIGAAVVVAGGLAWAGTSKPVAVAAMCPRSDFKGSNGPILRKPSGLAVQTIKAGTGPMPAPEDYVLINYKGMLRDGKVFDQAERAPLELSAVVPGFRDALVTMQKDGKYRVCIPPALGYGSKGAGPIPANSTLIFDIDLLEFRTAAEVQAIQAQMQQMQMQQQMQGAAPPPGRR